MGIWSSISKQFIDVIEWTEPDDTILAYRFPIADNEIQNGAQLTVRESQAALFVDEGRTGDLFGPGRYKLTTENLPIITKLKAWPYGFNSPFKSEVYFFSTRQKLGNKWGTPQPITVRDKEFGSVMVRMFGVFSYHVADPKAFYAKISGTREVFRTDDIAGQIVPQIGEAAAGAFGQSGIPFLDMAANQTLLSQIMKTRLDGNFAALGVALDAFVVESISLPAELQKVLQERQSMGIIGDMAKYTQLQTARAITEAAANEGGVAGVGAGLAAGYSIGNVMGGALGGATGQGGPGPGPGPGTSPVTPAPAATPAAATKACVACSKSIAIEDNFCKHCGKPQQLTCPNCKAVATGDSAFCAKCGTKLS